MHRSVGHAGPAPGVGVGVGTGEGVGVCCSVPERAPDTVLDDGGFRSATRPHAASSTAIVTAMSTARIRAAAVPDVFPIRAIVGLATRKTGTPRIEKDAPV
ncbi:MAG: hypothetical protein JWR71_2704 [Pseudarthrobacter sp.]|nr:hypothetical protein [Pseudarthrobacter sp.]